MINSSDSPCCIRADSWDSYSCQNVDSSITFHSITIILLQIHSYYLVIFSQIQDSPTYACLQHSLCYHFTDFKYSYYYYVHSDEEFYMDLLDGILYLPHKNLVFLEIDLIFLEKHFLTLFSLEKCFISLENSFISLEEDVISLENGFISWDNFLIF